MEINITAIGPMTCVMAKEKWISVTETTMKVSGLMTCAPAKVRWSILTETYLQATGGPITSMDKVPIGSPTEPRSKDPSAMISPKESASSH